MDLVADLAHPGGWQHMGGWGGMMVGAWLLTILLAALIGWLIFLTTRRPGNQSQGQSRARLMLDERYAAGDISRDEYLERKADLEG